MRAKVLVMAGGILLAGIISMSVLTNSQSQSSPMQRLPDGSWLKIVSISYAPAYSYDMPRPKLWQSFLLKHLPSSYSAHLGLWHGTGRVGGSSARAGETNLAVITVCKQATPTSLCSSAQMDVFDERTRKGGTLSPEPQRPILTERINGDWSVGCSTRTFLMTRKD